ncbi:T9SS type A sorting domain-containing protein [Fulvivirga sediminis]|uniref:T9SS type A sorting domain-containing protein n=1 Tax=Fulvivirga sediminis TaxID=2803949 RepID=A0A937FBG2_9BACT|nr:T9SS type A sorting domain-containing protein [Fulvivirga sediminis]MBL3658906.1 T9SS type A sorting domain-containing protein [Fulvivirga sediminis]
MKKTLLLTILTLSIALLSQFAFAQKGEVRRFDNASIENTTNIVKLFPNPTIDYLNIKIENSELKHATFTVHNIIGNVVEVKVEEVEENRYRVKVDNLSPGYYFLAIRDEKGHFKETYKFLKRQ